MKVVFRIYVFISWFSVRIKYSGGIMGYYEVFKYIEYFLKVIVEDLWVCFWKVGVRGRGGV